MEPEEVQELGKHQGERVDELINGLLAQAHSEQIEPVVLMDRIEFAARVLYHMLMQHARELGAEREMEDNFDDIARLRDEEAKRFVDEVKAIGNSIKLREVDAHETTL